MAEQMNPHLAEAAALAEFARTWLDQLALSGVSKRGIRSAVMQSLWEFSLQDTGPEETEAWLRRQADYAKEAGADFLAVLRGGDGGKRG